jgi:SPP1 family predicted phage head-tail adaptor
MNPGLLNRRLTLEAPVEVADGAGGVIRTYESVATLWASVTPREARTPLDAEQAGGTITHRIGVRFCAGITTRHRLRDGARVFRIIGLRDRDGRGRFLQIDAQERTV